MSLREQRCPTCGKLLFKVSPESQYMIEIICSGIACKAASRIGESRVKLLQYPNPISVTRRTQ